MRLDPPRRPYFTVYLRNLVIPETNPRIVRVAGAAAAQHGLVVMHLDRLIETRDRYEHGTLPWAEAELHRVMWLEIRRVLDAIIEGKTVQPS